MNKPPPDDDVGDEGFLYRTAPKISRPIAASFLTTKLQRTTNQDALDRPSTNSLMGVIDRELPPRKLRLRLVSRRCWDAPRSIYLKHIIRTFRPSNIRLEFQTEGVRGQTNAWGSRCLRTETHRMFFADSRVGVSSSPKVAQNWFSRL